MEEITRSSEAKKDMTQITRENVFAKTARGAAALTLREIVAFPISVLFSVGLARLLTPAEFGIFATVMVILSTISGTRDLGLSAALVYQKEEPCVRELRTAFTFQMLLCSGFYALLILLAKSLLPLFRLPSQIDAFIIVVGLTIFLLPFNSIAFVFLQRRLSYRTNATIDFLQNLVYQVVALLLAWRGRGIWSFGIAYIAASLLRTALLFLSNPWRVGFSWDSASLKRGIGYGVIFHLSGMTALLRDGIPVFIAGPLFGPQAVGYLNWASRLTQQASQSIVSIIDRISFPSLARLQNDQRGLDQMVATTIRYIALCTLSLLAVLCALAPEIVRLIYTSKWAYGIPALYLFAFVRLAQAFITPLDNLLKATGSPQRSLKVMLAWTVGSCVAAAAAARVLGFVGVAVGYALTSCSVASFLLLRVRRRYRVDLRYVLLRPFLAGLVAFVMTSLIKGHYVKSVSLLAGVGALGLLIYGAVLWILERDGLVVELKEHAGWLRRAMQGSY